MPKLVPAPEPTTDLWALIAHHLRFLRLQKGKSQANVGAIISASIASVSRIERGEEMLDEKQDALLDKEWDTGGLFCFLIYHATRNHNSAWREQCLHLEASAHFLRVYEALIVPGIFQTPEYARALILSGRYASRADELVAGRMERADIFRREPPPEVWVILSENALSWPIGGLDVMRGQLERLLDLARLDTVGIRVVPRSSGASPAMDGSFMIMTLEVGDTAFSDSPGGGRLISEPAEVREYLGRYERIGSRALSGSDSLALIHRYLENIE
ncbi:helix-turn-helix transcriptional regulator [Actinocorallia aurantiaca]|uniref:DUF5753 domain-containing protein n=1 Tax=Actinocorallia aurantiaca TaxID=46204 RepID=A0ABP6GM31_9ACTN